MTGISAFKTLEENSTTLTALTAGEITILNEIQAAIAAVASTRGTAADLRVTVIGGNITATVSTVSTVSTVTNQANTGGQPANTLIPSTQNMLVANTFAQNIRR